MSWWCTDGRTSYYRVACVCRGVRWRVSTERSELPRHAARAQLDHGAVGGVEGVVGGLGCDSSGTALRKRRPPCPSASAAARVEGAMLRAVVPPALSEHAVGGEERIDANEHRPIAGSKLVNLDNLVIPVLHHNFIQ